MVKINEVQLREHARHREEVEEGGDVGLREVFGCRKSEGAAGLKATG